MLFPVMTVSCLKNAICKEYNQHTLKTIGTIFVFFFFFFSPQFEKKLQRKMREAMLNIIKTF